MTLHDPILGPLTWDNDRAAWSFHISIADQPRDAFLYSPKSPLTPPDKRWLNILHAQIRHITTHELALRHATAVGMWEWFEEDLPEAIFYQPELAHIRSPNDVRDFIEIDSIEFHESGKACLFYNEHELVGGCWLLTELDANGNITHAGGFYH